jgi:hypothetical protein
MAQQRRASLSSHDTEDDNKNLDSKKGKKSDM